MKIMILHNRYILGLCFKDKPSKTKYAKRIGFVSITNDVKLFSNNLLFQNDWWIWSLYLINFQFNERQMIYWLAFVSLSVPVLISRKQSQSGFLIKLVQSESTIRNGRNQFLRGSGLWACRHPKENRIFPVHTLALFYLKYIRIDFSSGCQHIHRDKPHPFLR